MFANLVRTNARALTTVPHCSARSLSSRASIARPTLLQPIRMTLPSNAARRWMSDESSAQPRKILHLSNLPFNMAEDDIRHELQHFGVTNIYKRTGRRGRPTGWALVEFETEEAAAMVMRDHLARPLAFSGQRPLIEWAKKQEDERLGKLKTGGE
ncbi:hypothetical protein BDZ89DRAFT_1070398 [Hymenopellis radicata]|nr:hypothetical protein BDZ89DRAFT_1070398 [Hymenopellis radicata]